jgi:hypothetical protein
MTDRKDMDDISFHHLQPQHHNKTQHYESGKAGNGSDFDQPDRFRESSIAHGSKKYNESKQENTSRMIPLAGKEHLESWMTLLPVQGKSLPLTLLHIPGSHDSGSYDLKLWSKIRWDTIRNPKHASGTWHRLIPIVTRPLVKRWGQTQKYSIHSQLEHGIRYFDIRVAEKGNQGDFFFVHGLYGPKISRIAKDVNRFLEKHAGEVVILHVQHIFRMSANRQRSLLNLLIEIFGDKIAPFKEVNQTTINYSSSNSSKFEATSSSAVMTTPTTSSPSSSLTPPRLPSLEDLISKQRQILIFFPQETPIQSNLLWPSVLLPNPWANTTSTSKLIRFLDENIYRRCQEQLFVTQGVLTPNFINISKLKVVSTLKKQLAVPCNNTLASWIRERRTFLIRNSANIVMTDFVGHNHYEIARLVVCLNYPNIPFPEMTPLTSHVNHSMGSLSPYPMIFVPEKQSRHSFPTSPPPGVAMQQSYSEGVSLSSKDRQQ